MFLGQGAEVVFPIGGGTDCPSDYEYHWADSMCHQITSEFECNPPLVWSNISQDCVLSVGSSGGGETSPIPWNYILIGAAALLLLSFAGGRASSGGGRRKSQKIFSRTTTRTQFA